MAKFTKEDLQLIIGLADLALKADGLNAVKAVVPLVQKCEIALQELSQPTPEEPKAE